jgi:transcriptional regulator with XRE-family HTH domain
MPTIEDYRLQCGWSKNEMARKANMDFNTLQKVFNGEIVTIGTAKKLATAISKELGQTVRFQNIEGINLKNETTYEERRDTRFFEHTKIALKDAHEQLQQPLDVRYAAAYGIFKGYFEALLVNFAEAFSAEQLGEIRIVLDQLDRLVGHDEHLNEATKAKQDQLAWVLRETED